MKLRLQLTHIRGVIRVIRVITMHDEIEGYYHDSELSEVITSDYQGGGRFKRKRGKREIRKKGSHRERGLE